MKEFLLILHIFSPQGSTTTTVDGFKSESACNQSGTKIVSVYADGKSKIGSPNQVAEYICVQIDKG